MSKRQICYQANYIDIQLTLSQSFRFDGIMSTHTRMNEKLRRCGFFRKKKSAYIFLFYFVGLRNPN